MILYVSETSFRNNIMTTDVTAIDDKIRDKKKVQYDINRETANTPA